MRHLELFAGIGGFRKAIDILGENYNFPTNCVGFSEIDKYATTTYKANYETANEVELGDIIQFTTNADNINNLPDFDLLTGGFPCQPFSMMGKQEGFNDHRGNVFYNIVDILRVKQPRYILLENVKNLFTHNKGKTFKEVNRALEAIGYKIYFDIFNTKDFDLAQIRNRVIILGIRQDIDIDEDFVFNKEVVLSNYRNNALRNNLLIQNSVLDVLDRDVEEKYYLSEKIKPTILANGSKNYMAKSEINQLIARPLTATMAKMHRANQDNYYSQGFLTSENPVEYVNIQFSKEELAEQPIRRITPKEALALQGFNENFYQNAVNAKVSNAQLYKQAGNAVSVNTIYAILHYLFVNNLDI